MQHDMTPWHINWAYSISQSSSSRSQDNQAEASDKLSSTSSSCPFSEPKRENGENPSKKVYQHLQKKIRVYIHIITHIYIYISLNFKLLQKHFLRVPLLFYRTVAAICLVMRQPGVCLPWRDIQSHEIGPLSLAKQQSAGTEMSSELLN